MGEPAATQGDRVTGTCVSHQIPNPTSGAPQPAGPLPFSAPLVQGLANTVVIEKKSAAIMGSSGFNTPPHIGLHVSDPNLAPNTQLGRVTGGSATVSIEGTPAAKTGSPSACCAQPGQLAGSATSVLIGG
jgi:uncharacterized Zn-binding protein involved in type VI secretion